jgi:beta-aspartyl-peptidase (threonine type)
MDRNERRRFLQSAIAFSGVLGMPSLAFAQPPAKKRYAIALHGGAGSSAEKKNADESRAVEASLAKALDIGVGILEGGGTSLDAVERVIRYLEDDPLFNAGRGAVFNAAGTHELDASIMDGRTKACGGVAAIRTVKNPISLARLVMEKTKHVLLTSDGAEQFADEMKVERVANSWFSTEKRRQELEKARQQEGTKGKQSRDVPKDLYYGTVGCVALDSHGNLAAGTSTGGRTNKRFGRVGDSPINGAGNYANNATCAVSGTGIGEEFIRHAVAYDVSARMAYLKQSLKDSVHDVMHKTLRPDDGGLIAVSADGSIVMDFSTGGMARAAADSSGYREVKIGK